MAERDHEEEQREIRGTLPARTALASILGFWFVHLVIITARAVALDFPSQGELALRRLAVTLAGIGITILLWRLNRLSEGMRPLWRIVIAALACVPAALVIAMLNYYLFNVYDQASLLEVEKMRLPLESRPSMWEEVGETAFGRYFFLIAWSAIYMALGYAYEVRSAERRAAQYARAAQLAELRALRYQINPHFLFNALNSLSALVMRGSKSEAERMIMNLATFYRAGIDGNASGDIPLSEEIETQRLYLEIERVRFPDRLSIEIDVPPELADAEVPGLILQPLVENSIKHGVSRSTAQVVIRIAAREEEGRLTISVSDDAAGRPSTGTPGIGLTNVRDRLAARFGGDASLHVGRIDGSGFLARLNLPLVRHG